MRAETALRVAVPVAILLTASGAIALAFVRGGGADPSVALPGPVRESDAGPTAPSRPGGGLRDYAVTTRFTESMGTARVDAPKAADVEGVLASHWRKLRPPFVKVPNDLARFVSSFSLRTSEKEEQHSVTTTTSSTSGPWRPDVRLWNMNEGSFDQRESIVLPAPATITFPIELPTGARITFGAGSANASKKTLLFRVQFTPSSGPAPRPCEQRVAPERARLWTDVTCDLGGSSGQAGTLAFSVTPVEPLADEAPRKRHGGPRQDGGAAQEDAILEGSGQTPIALFGQPTLWGRSAEVPYNVLWIVVDALRPDAVASLHDDARDAKMLAAESPPLDALLPKMPGLMPGLDGLAAEGRACLPGEGRSGVDPVRLDRADPAGGEDLLRREGDHHAGRDGLLRQRHRAAHPRQEHSEGRGPAGDAGHLLDDRPHEDRRHGRGDGLRDHEPGRR